MAKKKPEEETHDDFFPTKMDAGLTSSAPGGFVRFQTSQTQISYGDSVFLAADGTIDLPAGVSWYAGLIEAGILKRVQ